eukprot:364837-Chlamydomonas_euryale.AAC.10
MLCATVIIITYKDVVLWPQTRAPPALISHLSPVLVQVELKSQPGHLNAIHIRRPARNNPPNTQFFTQRTTPPPKMQSSTQHETIHTVAPSATCLRAWLCAQRLHRLEVWVTRAADGKTGRTFVADMTEERSVELASKIASEGFVFTVGLVVVRAMGRGEGRGGEGEGKRER